MATRKIFDSAELVLLCHSQRIPLATGTCSVYGVLAETQLTSTHPFHILLSGITRDNIHEKL